MSARNGIGGMTKTELITKISKFSKTDPLQAEIIMREIKNRIGYDPGKFVNLPDSEISYFLLRMSGKYPPTAKAWCEYCHCDSADDARGNCANCGGGRAADILISGCKNRLFQ